MSEDDNETPPEASGDFHDQIAAFVPAASYAPPTHTGAPSLPWYVRMLTPARYVRSDERWPEAAICCAIFGLLSALTIIHGGGSTGRSGQRILGTGVALLVFSVPAAILGLRDSRRSGYQLGIVLSVSALMLGTTGICLGLPPLVHLLSSLTA